MLSFLERKSNKWRISSKTNLATLMLTSNVPCKHKCKFTVGDLLVIVFCYFRS